jgi:peptide chain release factor 2
VVGVGFPLKGVLQPVKEFRRKVDDLQAMLELEEESDGDDAALLADEIASSAPVLRAELDELEIKSFLSGPMDKNNAIMNIHAGAGGTESCDWADMLLRLYTALGRTARFRGGDRGRAAGGGGPASRARRSGSSATTPTLRQGGTRCAPPGTYQPV